VSKLPQPIQPLFDFWKSELPLRDWDIKFDVRRAWDMGGDHGRVEVLEVKRCAFIQLLDPRDANPMEMQPYDMEVTLVHELLHCCFAPFLREDISEHEDVCQEQAVHGMSLALVAMRRKFEAGPTRRRPVTILEEKAA
jgi:hypothetical protein